MTDPETPQPNNQPSLDTPSTRNATDKRVRSAFEELTTTSGRLNTSEALRNVQNTKPAAKWKRPAVLAAAGVAALAGTVGALTYPTKDNSNQIATNTITTTEQDPVATTPITQANETKTTTTATQPTTTPQPSTPPQTVAKETSFTDLACGASGPTTQNTKPATSDHVIQIMSHTSPTCRRSVFFFNNSNSTRNDGAAPKMVQEVDSKGRLKVTLPSGWIVDHPEAFESYQTDSIFIETGAGVAVVVNASQPYLYIDHGVGTTTTELLSNPTRLVVDTKTGANPTGYQPRFANSTYVPIIGTNPTGLNVKGIGSNFEATGDVELRVDSGGAAGTGKLVEGNWSGASVINSEQKNVSSIGYRSGANWLWNEFSFTVSGLKAGKYKLVFLPSDASGERPNPADILEIPFTVESE